MIKIIQIKWCTHRCLVLRLSRRIRRVYSSSRWGAFTSRMILSMQIRNWDIGIKVAWTKLILMNGCNYKGYWSSMKHKMGSNTTAYRQCHSKISRSKWLQVKAWSQSNQKRMHLYCSIKDRSSKEKHWWSLGAIWTLSFTSTKRSISMKNSTKSTDKKMKESNSSWWIWFKMCSAISALWRTKFSK